MHLWEITVRSGDATYTGICPHHRMPAERDVAECALKCFHQTAHRIDVTPITMAQVKEKMRIDPGYGLVMCTLSCPLRDRAQRPALKLVMHEKAA